MRNALIVDDSTWIHALVRSQLGQEFTLHSAYDGVTGLDHALSHHPEFILLDVDLPDMHGFDVCRELKANQITRSIPIIFLTSAEEIDARIGGLNCGACDYVTKPFDPVELRARVNAVLRERHINQSATALPMMDAISGLFNQKYLGFRLDGEIARARRSGNMLACFMVKIECKYASAHSIETAHHEQIMGHVAQAVRQACRKEDVMCRHGIDTLAVLAVSRDRAASQLLAERMQDYVKASELTGDNFMPALKVSVGVGLSRFSKGMSVVHDAIAALASARQCVFGKVVVGSEIVQLQLAG